MPFEQLLRESDVVIVTCPLNETTKNLFGPAQFAMMKSSAVLINTSRGGCLYFFYTLVKFSYVGLLPYVTGVVDQDALIDALKTRKISAAGLDVMTPEPLPVNHELTKLKNCGMQLSVYLINFLSLDPLM